MSSRNSSPTQTAHCALNTQRHLGLHILLHVISANVIWLHHPDPDLLVVCASSWSRAPLVLWEILGHFLRLWCASEARFWLRGALHMIFICSEAHLSKLSQNYKSKRLWECSEPMTHGILTLLILTFRDNDESIKKMLLFLSLSKGPIPEDWQLPPPGQMWTDSLILEDQLVGLVYS